ncbi:hypothetical protein F2Q69_00048043 [Brassica cretica]|uniref:Uncharacterized protein n=1 Tax=Brassica cretica TaxID=69181 RepID=A0A8S9Q628_BRACR|nr:hypothetical protein F2Q69_00048043 [Brassica cretica]
MIGLLGKSRGGRCSPSPDGWLSRGLSIVELAVGFVVTTLGRSLGFTSCYDCVDIRRIVPLKIDFLAREVYAGFFYPFYRYYPSYCWIQS